MSSGSATGSAAYSSAVTFALRRNDSFLTQAIQILICIHKQVGLKMKIGFGKNQKPWMSFMSNRCIEGDAIPTRYDSRGAAH